MAITTDPVQLVLRNELLTDPLSIGYGPVIGDANALLTLLTTPRSQAPKVFNAAILSASQIIAVLVKLRKWESIVIAANTPLAIGHADSFLLQALAQLPNLDDDFTASTYTTILTNLQVAGLLSASDITAIQNMSRVELLRSRADILGITPSIAMIQQSLAN